MKLDLDFADMEFVLEDNSRRPAHKALVAAASDVIKAAMNWLRHGDTAQGCDVKFTYELADCHVGAADAFIKILYGATVRDALPKRGRFHLWIELIRLAHRLNYNNIDLIIYANITVEDYKLYFETARLLGIIKMIRFPASYEVCSKLVSDISNVIDEIDIDTVRWLLGVASKTKTFDTLLSAAIISRKDVDEQRYLMMLINENMCRSHLIKIADSVKDPVAEHLVRLIIRAKE